METWLPAVGYEGRYEVSDAGRVRNRQRRILKPGNSGAGRHADLGYLMVMLVPRKKRYVHHMVAEAFIGPRPDGQVVRHLDDNRLNNAATNLAYGSTVQNNREMAEHGRHWKGRNTECANGHEYTPESSYWNGKQRVCRKCRAMRVAEWNKRNPDYGPAAKRRRRRELKTITSQGSSPR